MRKHGFITNELDQMAIIRRIDMDGDAKISFDELAKALTPG